MLKIKNTTKYISLYVISFFTGVSIMILELVASRIITPYAGNTIHTWTNIIGIILISLALGYLLGGKLADHNPSLKNVSKLLIISAIYILGIAYLYKPILYYLMQTIPDVRIQAFVSGLLLFSLPSICLAAISPFIAKSVLTTIKNAGSQISLVYTASTLGSIVGTYITGYILIARYGSQTILLFVSVILFILSLYLHIFFKRNIILWILFIIYFLFCLFLYFNQPKLHILVDDESQYQKIWIYNYKKPQGRYERYLATDQYGTQGRQYLDDSIALVSTYTKFFDLFTYFKPDTKNTLMLGGGAYSYPKYFIHNYPTKTMDVVEIDKKITEYAYAYFGLKDNPNLHIYHDDARNFMNRNKKKYDVIFIDAFSSISIPYQLTTQEAVKTYYNSLNSDGVVIFNVISSLEGDKKNILLAQYKTFSSIFPKLIVLPVQDSDPHSIQNIIVVALKNDKKDYLTPSSALQAMLNRKMKTPLHTDLPIFTDDYAPVDYYSLPLFNDRE